MSEVEQADQEFCSKILKYTRIIDNLVILCEGLRGYLNIHSPEQIGELEYLPDANFWKQTIPYSSWRNKKPIFIPCGSRSDVIRIYPKLIELHNDDPDNSYLSPEKLFILIDLDIQCQDISNICPHYQTTEELYHAIYENNPINTNVIDKSKIIITGWIHKEAYFLEPDLQDYLQQELPLTKITYKNNPLSLEEIYKDMIEDINSDADIDQNLDNVLKRIEKFLSIPIPDKNSLINECTKLKHNSTITPEEKRKLIEVILKTVKAKPYWEEQIIIEDDYLSKDKAEDNVLLAISRFYANSCNLSNQSNSTLYHIPQWVNFLYAKNEELNR
ncbi:hypothetical protein [Crocosphaera chwakensis]|uniref:Bifunctional ornithine acetyltransferase/N-acetylglutamate synthase protein n=1 Tax=Crocosphaera chwakensis CCY0110 TaxID=391612 RepID=A3ISS3_9CHRO|nr:hypothetical protein [Crocosphaera chwakensis]EAZ90493.1 bifunctional ornithine acetyltransferase/N-acetylglutamate synthase protein [Crocosphaera chwakensis CCY0110]